MSMKKRSKSQVVQSLLLRCLDRNIHYRLQHFVTANAQVLCKLRCVCATFNNYVMLNSQLWGIVFFSKISADQSLRPGGLDRALALAAQCGNVHAKLVTGHAGYQSPIFCDTGTFCHASTQIGRTLFLTGGAMVSKRGFNKDLLKIEILTVGEGTGCASKLRILKTKFRYTGLSPRIKHVSAAFGDASGAHQIIILGGIQYGSASGCTMCDSTVWRLDLRCEPFVWVVQPCTGTPPASICASASAFDRTTHTLYVIAESTFALDVIRWEWHRVAPSPWISLPRQTYEKFETGSKRWPVIIKNLPMRGGKRANLLLEEQEGEEQVTQHSAACIVKAGQPNAALCVTGGRGFVNYGRRDYRELGLMFHLPLARPGASWVVRESLACTRSGHTCTACNNSDTIILLGGHCRIGINFGTQVFTLMCSEFISLFSTYDRTSFGQKSYGV